MKRLLSLAGLLLYATHSFAMRCDTDTVKRIRIFDKIQIRQSFQDATETENPASFMLSIPSSGRDNWLVDGGVSARFVPLSGLNGVFKVTGEFHRNTLIDSIQYNWQAGFNYAYLKPENDGKLAFSWTANLKYDRDVKDTTHSITTTLNVSLYQTGRHCLNWGRPGYTSNYKNTYQLDPSIQVQYQQYLGNDTHSGAVVRPLVDLSAAYAWNGKRKKGLMPPKLFEIAASYSNRYAIINNTGNKEGYSKLLRAGVNYYFLNSSSTTVSLGVNYNRGSDPLNGLKDQNYLQIAFQVQI